MRKYWYAVFLLAATLIALYPPTIVSEYTGQLIKPANPDRSSPDGAEYRDMIARTEFVSVFGAQPMFSQGRDWGTFVALETICLVAFVVFAFRTPN